MGKGGARLCAFYSFILIMQLKTFCSFLVLFLPEFAEQEQRFLMQNEYINFFQFSSCSLCSQSPLGFVKHRQQHADPTMLPATRFYFVRAMFFCFSFLFLENREGCATWPPCVAAALPSFLQNWLAVQRFLVKVQMLLFNQMGMWPTGGTGSTPKGKYWIKHLSNTKFWWILVQIGIFGGC